MKQPFHLMAKPTSYQCNLACDYCFYLEKVNSVLTKEKTITRHMSDEVLKEFIKQYVSTNPAPNIEFTWQGGEPTMAGIEFFERVLIYQQKFAAGKHVYNSIQTNGILIDECWARFLAKHQFLVGISIDGPSYLHDKYRKTHSGRSVFSQVLNAVKLLKQHCVDFNVLTVINDQTVLAPLEIYRFLTQELGAEFIQFIPIVEQAALEDSLQQKITHNYGELIYPTAPVSKALTSWSITGKQYGEFMKTIFDYWVCHDVGRIYVQLFDNALAAWSGDMPSLCVMRPTCGQGLVVEQNGDIYSCDHFVYPEYKLGNLLMDKLSKMVYSKQQQKFGQAKSNLSVQCQLCDYKFACYGGCPKHRFQQADGKLHNHLCEGYKMLFSHIDPYMRYMAHQLANRMPPASVMKVVTDIAAAQKNLNIIVD